MRVRLIIAASLVVVTVAVYWPALHAGFIIELDDSGYVVENPQVQRGLTPQFFGWAFTSIYLANWSPLTWISHAIDYQLFGLEPRGHHAVNVLLHALNVLLLFLVLDRMTGRTWRCALVAALFGLHPLHVESVAWVSERKDVLSTLFWLLTMASYRRFARRGGAMAYLLVVACFALGLMAKAMLVTLPAVLLLLDVWPLKRVRLWTVARDDEAIDSAMAPVRLRRAIVEKLPLLAIAFAVSIVTVIAQRHGQAVRDFDAVSLASRLANASVAYITYLWHTVWPVSLAAYYPHRQPLPAADVAGSLLLLCIITLVAAWRARRQPYLLIGWLWYLGTLVPVIGLVQVGDQAMADRYTYVPLIGIFIAFAWWLGGVAGRFPIGRPIASIACALALAALCAGTWRQAGLWRDAQTLFRQALRVTRDNYFMHNGLGSALLESGRPDEALEHFERSLRIKPEYVNALNNAGGAALSLGRMERAIAHYRKAVELSPNDHLSRCNLAAALALAGKIDEADAFVTESLRLKPDHPPALLLHGQIRAAQGRLTEALPHYDAALLRDPSLAQAHVLAAEVLIALGRVPEAEKRLSEALRIEPDNADARAHLDALAASPNLPATAPSQP